MTDSQFDTNTPDARQRRSPFLFVAGVAAILVALWGLLGGPTLPNLNVVPWILVTVGVVAGVSLIASGLRKN